MEQQTTSCPVAQKLCARCARLDLQNIFHPDHELAESADLGVLESWRSSTCDLCEFLTLSVKQQVLGNLSKTAPIDRFFSLQGCGSLRKQRAALPLGVIEGVFSPADMSGLASVACLEAYSLKVHMVRTSVELRSKSDLALSMVDFDSIERWLEMSAADRGFLASHGTRWASQPDWNDATVLWVIDCTNRSIIQLPLHTAYVTLSYVWGNTDCAAVSQEQHNIRSLPSDLPATIEDSIVVCSKLNYRYLWIDRYCIPQHDIMERHRNIQAMDRIYMNSDLTIIACAGSNGNYGLPGVSSPRLLCPSLYVGGLGYLQTVPTTHEISNSVWAHRGWTYQEALLSQTRLYFTSSQVFFENEHSASCEWYWRAGHKRVATSQSYMLFSQTALMARPAHIYGRIIEFADRHLSYESDRLDAMRGIFAAFDRKFQVRNLSGLPFKSDPPGPLEKASGTLRISLLCSLLFQVGHGAIRCRRFPSWTWAGWTKRPEGIDSVIFTTRINSGSEHDPCKAIELAPNRIITWEAYQASYDQLQSEHHIQIRHIYIEAWMSTFVGIQSEPHSSEPHSACRIFVTLPNETNIYLRGMTHERSAALFDGEPYAMLRFSIGPQRKGRQQYVHMLVRNVGSYWERVWLFTEVGYKDKDGGHLDPHDVPFTLETIRMG